MVPVQTLPHARQVCAVSTTRHPPPGREATATILIALFGLVQNGMNLASVGSYLQMVVLGVLLIIAVIADTLRQRYFSR